VTERFTLLTELGRGGMGVVWKARDEETGQIVALKLLREAFAEDAAYVTRFERELELAKRIHSRNVVQVLGFGVRGGTPYLVLEFVDGPTLRERLATHGPYSWPDAKALVAQITQGLADAHAAGVIHRDLKPSNVLIAPDGVAKLADFGIAKGVDLARLTATSAMLGTPAYLAPEGPIDGRSDLYSLGIVGFELLSGTAPFAGTTYQEVIIRHIREAPDLARLPAGARPIIGWLLAKDPAARPQRASDLLPVLFGAASLPRSTAPAARASATAAPVTPAMPAAPFVSARAGAPMTETPLVAAFKGWWTKVQAIGTSPVPPAWGNQTSLPPAFGAGRSTQPPGAPGWPLTMAMVRDGHTAAMLPDGRVLLAGGTAAGFTATAEQFGPRTASFHPSGFMSSARFDHTATVLSDGRVLVVGGYDGRVALDSAEAYDHRAGTFVRAGSMSVTRVGHSAVLLPSGRVLIAGGHDQSVTVATAEVFDPASGRFYQTGSMTWPRAYHTATLLSDGRLLIAGGCSGPQALSTAEMYDPASGTFSRTGSMMVARDSHTATPLPDGRVLIVGGEAGFGQDAIGSAELFDPRSGSFWPAGQMASGRVHHTATLLHGGRVVVAGGRSGSTQLSSVEMYDPRSGVFGFSRSMSAARARHTATPLFDGRVLMAGGIGGSRSSVSAELYKP